MVARPACYTLLFCTVGLCAAWSQQSQIETARQFDTTRESPVPQSAPAVPASPPQSEGGTDLDSFGVQQMLVCGPERARYFRTFGELSGFVTNNVGLSRRDPQADSFLVGSFGLEYRRPLKRNFQVDASFQVAMFRYSEFRQLNFNSFDVGAGIGYHSNMLGGVDLSARYNYNALLADSNGDKIFENHTITAAVEKIFPFSRAHYALLGVSAKAGFANPRPNERHEIGAYAGYHIEVVPKLDVDVGYRYAYYGYTANGRRDHNHTLSLGARYRLREWCSASVNSFYVWDRSNASALSYTAGSVGGSLMLMLRF